MSAPAQRVVLVTGGTKGIGRTIATTFLDAGHQVVICARQAPEAPVVGADGRQAEPWVCNVRDTEAVAQMFEHIAARYGRLDVLVNNAGGAPHTDAATASPRFHASIIDLNLTAPLHLAQRAYALMNAGDGGVIVSICSVSGTRASPGTAAYGAAKAGLLSLTKSLAVEWAPRVRVTAIVAGLIETEQAHMHYGDDAGIARVAATVPLGRLGTPADVAKACVFLASDDASYISGTALTLDGGGEWPAFLRAAAGHG